MTDSTIKTKRGQSVGLYISDSSEVERRIQQPATEDQKKKFVGSDEEDDRYVFRKGAITFFDLGTRLRSVPPTTFDRLRVRDVGELSIPEQHDSWFNEYVEMALDIAHDVNDHTLTAGEAASHTVEILGSLGGSDPLNPLEFSPANNSGRNLPHCMPLPYHAEWLWADAVLYNDEGERRYAIGVDEKRPFVNSTLDGPLTSDGRWQKTKAAPDEENWNPLNDMTGDGELRAPFSGRHLKIDTAAFYESLDTGDSDLYKWTSGSSFGSPEVDMPTLSGKLVRVFLVPRIQHLFVGYTTVYDNAMTTNLVVPSCTTRLAVYPNIGELHWIGTLGNGRRNFWVTRGFARAMSASLERSPKLIEDRIPQDVIALASAGASSITGRRNGIFALSTLSPYARAGQIIGIVEISGTPYFGWLKADDTDHTQKINSLSAPSETNFNPQASMPSGDWNLTPQFLYSGADDETSATVNASNDYQTPIL